jgi:hypothetical protein
MLIRLRQRGAYLLYLQMILALWAKIICKA